MTKQIEDKLEYEKNMTALKALRDKLTKVDLADWPQDIEEEFQKLKAESSNNND